MPNTPDGAPPRAQNETREAINAIALECAEASVCPPPDGAPDATTDETPKLCAHGYAEHDACDECSHARVFVGSQTRARDEGPPDIEQAVWALRDIANEVGPSEHMELHLAADLLTSLQSTVAELQGKLAALEKS